MPTSTAVTGTTSDHGRAASPRQVRVRGQLLRSRAQALQILAAVGESRSIQRPSATQWSACEILEHVGLVEAAIVRMLDDPPHPSRVKLVQTARVRFVRRLPVRARLWLLARRFGRVSAPKYVVPATGATYVAVLETAAATRVALLERLDRMDAKRFASIRVPHAALGMLDGLQWVEFLAAHEERHLVQMRAGLARLGS